MTYPAIRVQSPLIRHLLHMYTRMQDGQLRYTTLEDKAAPGIAATDESIRICLRLSVCLPQTGQVRLCNPSGWICMSCPQSDDLCRPAFYSATCVARPGS